MSLKNFLHLLCATPLLAMSYFSSASEQNTSKLTMLMQDSQPKYFLPNDPRKGLCVEIYQALAERLKVQQINSDITSKFLPIKRILKSVEINSNHIFCGAGRNAEREKRFIYSETAVYHVSNVVASHKDQTFEIQSFDDVKDQQLVIGALYGTSSAAFVKKQTGVRINDSFLDLRTGLKAVSNQRIALFYYHDLGLNFLIKDWQLPLKVVPHKFRTVPQWIIYSKSIDPELHQKAEQALKEMENEGVIKEIWTRYF